VSIELAAVKSTPLHPVIVGSLIVAAQEILSVVVVSVVVVSVVVVSVVVVSVVVVSLVVDAPPSLLLLQEMMVRLKRDMKIMYKTFFIFFLYQ
jgi:hypothetical protein